MKPSAFHNQRRAFTLVEVMVAGALFAMIGSIAYYILNAGTVLYAKNSSLNISGATVRDGADRINREVSQATDLPQLVVTGSGGSFTTSSNAPSTSNAAGIIFDKYLGGPYILESTGVSTAVNFSLKRSTNALVVAPVPQADDVLLIDGSSMRSRIHTASAGSVSNGLQSLTISLKSGSSTGVAWTSSEKRPVSLIRRVAFIVVGSQLRYYPTMEGVTNYTNAPYSVITNDLGVSSGESTPFSLVMKNGRPFLSMNMRIQNREGNYVLANKESREFNTFMRVDTLLRPRNATY